MKKPLDKGTLLESALNSDESLAHLICQASTDRSSARYTFTKVIRLVSEKSPALVYPYFDIIAGWLDEQNSFVKWDAILTLSNLAEVDTGDRLEQIKARYFALLEEKSLVTAGNVIGAAWKIVAARPDWEPELTGRFLDMKNAIFLHHGQVSPECTRVVCGHVLDYLDRIYDRSSQKKAIQDFASEQAASPRQSLAKKAQAFLRKHPAGKAGLQ
jgi:hypothetical protein